MPHPTLLCALALFTAFASASQDIVYDAYRTDITPPAERGLASRKNVPVKILGVGDLSKKLTVSAHGFSKSAREKIEGAGGTCTVLED